LKQKKIKLKMLKQICLMLAVAVLAQSAPVSEPVNETWKELPCLGKVAGERLPHPKNNHQFLRCVTADSVWIETCPDNLFYNPHSSVCDWDMEAKETTTSKPEVVKTRPVLVKFRPVDESGMRSVQSTVVQDAQQPGMVNPSGQEILTTASPVQIITTKVAPAAVEETTTPRVEIVFDTTPVAPVVVQQPTSTVQPAVVVVDAQTPAATFEVPVSTPVAVVAAVESISSTTPVATFEVPVSTTTTPAVVPQTPAPVVVVETTTPVFVRTTTPVVLTTTQRVVPVVAVETTTLPVVELSTERPISLRMQA